MGGFRPRWKVAAPVPVARRTDNQGRVFHSQKEMVWYLQLELLQSAGGIRGLRRQVRYHLVLPDGTPVLIYSAAYPKGRVAVYTLDAEWDEPIAEGAERGKWRHVYAEYKGYDEGDPAAQLRRAFFEAIYHCRVTLSGPAATKIKRKVAKREAAKVERQTLREAVKRTTARSAVVAPPEPVDGIPPPPAV
jgi:hypothetical protein